MVGFLSRAGRYERSALTIELQALTVLLQRLGSLAAGPKQSRRQKRRQKRPIWVSVAGRFGKPLVACFGVLALAGCTDDAATRDATSASGFTQVRVEGYSFFGCGKDDAFHTAFTARGVDGRCISGVVCSGWLKGATLRVTGPASTCPPTALAPSLSGRN